ncbi:hypothetical protein NDU88_002565 [Pleurodeles waltl]|uniref:Uncharacterized protein n=1 Tax=Pleurodeles waltl TaxID=8319 RepID=A0AAV7W3M0_PLEWA|nr:hypothetical protein NDU88_002565 [Pleurodeles waltl]
MCRFGARCCVPNPNCLAERAVASAGTAFGRRSTSRLFPAWLAKIVSGKFPDSVNKDWVLDEVKKNQEKVKARFGARCCVTNPNCLTERAVASAGTAFGEDSWKEEKLASRRDSGALRGYTFNNKSLHVTLTWASQH